MLTVELHPAYFFACDDCGRDSFGHMICADLTREDKVDALRKMGKLESYEDLPDDVDGDLIMYPAIVYCQHCNAEFDVALPGSDEEDD